MRKEIGAVLMVMLLLAGCSSGKAEQKNDVDNSSEMSKSGGRYIQLMNRV